MAAPDPPARPSSPAADELPVAHGLEVTHGHLLNGRVRYAQPSHGFRSGIEPVLLAAAVPARPGEAVLEGGSGAGAALLCLAARVPELRGLGIERDPALAAMANDNAAANGIPGLRFLASDLTALPVAGRFDHACANPPYHIGSGTASPVPARETARRGSAELLRDWCGALAGPLRQRGTLTLVLPAALLPIALTAMQAVGCSATGVLPLWPKLGRPAKLLLLRGVKGGRAPLRLLPGLLLHRDDGSFTAETQAVLRDGAPLALE